MTLTLVREAMKTGWKLGQMRLGAVRVLRDVAKLSPPIEDREASVRGLEMALRETYLRNCDPAAPYQLVSSTIARLVITRFWLAVHYQLEAVGAIDSNMVLGPNPSANMRDQLSRRRLRFLSCPRCF